jgi:hypothetical protein
MNMRARSPRPTVTVDNYCDDKLYPRVVKAVEKILAKGKVVSSVDVLGFHTHDLKLVPSVTAYVRWGKGPKQRLRFTKTGDPKLEEAYARHFVWPGKGPFHPPQPRKTTDSKEYGPHVRGIIS